MKIALLISALGMMVLCLSAVSWFVLQLRWRLRVAEGEAMGI